MKKISIIGATVIGNRGAESMLGATIGRIKDKHPDAVFYVYSYYPEEDKLLLSDSDIIVHSSTPISLVAILFPFSILLGFFNLLKLNIFKKILPKSVRDLSDSDVLIDLAGVSFMDGRTTFLPFNIMTIWPAMLLGTPVVKFAQGLGSFKQFATKVSAKLFLPRCNQVFARGEITENYLNEFFPTKSNYQPAGDVAFSHIKGDSLAPENESYSDNVLEILSSLQNKKNNVIGFCPSSVVYSKSLTSGIDYVGVFVEVIEKLLQNKSNSIFLFPNATREKNMEKLRNNDLSVIQKIVKKLLENGVSEEKIVYIDKDINTDSIKSMIEYCDVTIVSRFHAMIASLSLVKPVMVLGWSHKYLEVMKQFDMQQWVVDYQDQKVDLVENIEKMLKDEKQLKDKIAKNLPVVKKQSFKQFEYLFREILDK